MTKFFVMAIKDSAVQAFMAPFVVQADAQAIRDLKHLVNEKENKLSANPDDYELYNIGMFDDQLGKVEACPPRMVVRLKDLVSKESNQ